MPGSRWHVSFDDGTHRLPRRAFGYPVRVKLHYMQFDIEQDRAALFAMFLAKYVDVKDPRSEIFFESYQGRIRAGWTCERNVRIRSPVFGPSGVVLSEHEARDVSRNLTILQGFRTMVRPRSDSSAKNKTDDNLREVFG